VTPADEFATLLKTAPAADRAQLILERLRAHVAGLLGRAVAAVPTTALFPWAAAGDRSPAGDPFFGVLRQSVKATLGWRIYPGEMAALTCLREVAEYLAREFEEPDATTPRGSSASAIRIAPSRTRPTTSEKVSHAGFVLSSPRAGSTLMRVMLHGHPELFAPPELNLLPFETMGQRAAWFREHGFGWMGAGVASTLSALGGLPAQQAHARIQAWEHADVPVADVYRALHAATRRRLLVDKSPLYAADSSFLQPAHERFHEPRFIHLVRHPAAVIDSLVRMRFHRLYGSSWPTWHPSPWKYAENCWVQMNENIRTCLRDVPPSHACVVRFEDLLADPEGVSTAICTTLGVPFHSAVLTPYDGDRLTHGRDRQQRTLGDLHFLDHGKIDPERGTHWQRVRLPIPLDTHTIRLAEAFGYETEHRPGAECW